MRGWSDDPVDRTQAERDPNSRMVTIEFVGAIGTALARAGVDSCWHPGVSMGHQHAQALLVVSGLWGRRASSGGPHQPWPWAVAGALSLGIGARSGSATCRPPHLSKIRTSPTPPRILS